MRELEDLVKLSKYAGERFDLVQAGGGNSSAKLNDGTMLIKASGFALSEVEPGQGYTRVRLGIVKNALDDKRIISLKRGAYRDRLISGLLGSSVIDSDNKPSIETFLHALLYKYTLHSHPLAAGLITLRKDWKAILEKLYKGRAAWVDYHTPGVELALALKRSIEEYEDKYGERPKAIFLQNHGLVVSSERLKEVFDITEDILKRAEGYLKIDIGRYKLTNSVSAIINSLKKTCYIAYLSSDADLKLLLKSKRTVFFSMPFCPDRLVYCGMKPLEIKDLESKKPVAGYYKRFSELPRIIVYKDNIFFIADNVKKAKEMEEVFKFHVLALCMVKGDISFLKGDELRYLTGWEAERYRQKVRN